MREVLVSLDGSFLENCTDEEIGDVFSSAVAESVGFVLLTKCGCEPERVMGEDTFAALPVLDIVPFEDHFPTDTQLYRMMTTKPSDLYAAQKEENDHDRPDA